MSFAAFATSAAPGPDAQTQAEGKFGPFLLGADSAGSRLEVLDGGRSVHYASVQDEKQKPAFPQAAFCTGPRMVVGSGVHFFEVLVESLAAGAGVGGAAAAGSSLRGRNAAHARHAPVISVGLSKLLPGAWHCSLGRTSASWCYRSDGTVASADVVTPFGEGYGAGDRVGVEFDTTACKISFFLNRSPVGRGPAFRHIELGSSSGILVPAVGLAKFGERLRLGVCWEGSFLGSNEDVKAAALAAAMKKTPRDDGYRRWGEREDGSGTFEFVNRWRGDRLAIADAGETVSHTDDFPQSAFVAGPVCKQGKRFFEIECVRCEGRVGSPERKSHLMDWCASVGVARVVTGSWRCGLGGTLTSWCYRCDGLKMRNDTTKNFGPPFCTGDTIGMELDMNAGTLRIFRNGADLGILYGGLQGETLVPAVGLAHHDDCFRLLTWWEGGRADRLKRVQTRFKVKGLQAFSVATEANMHAERAKLGIRLLTQAGGNGPGHLPPISSITSSDS